MKKMILSFSNSGDWAGYEWRWEFYLERNWGGAYILSSQQIITEYETSKVDPKRGFLDGVNVYDALRMMVSNAGYHLYNDQLAGIAEKLALFSPGMADEFRKGPELLRQRQEDEEDERRKAESEREGKLRAYRDIIDKYVERFSDDPVRAPGWSRPIGTRRIWLTRFIENYVVEHGRLPTGEHYIKVQGPGFSYSGSLHDFSDLK